MEKIQTIAMTIFEKEELKKFLPHRELALILDRIIYDKNFSHKIIGKKFILENELYTAGHFPGNPILPGHWQIEMFALTAAVLVKLAHPEIVGLPKLISVKTEFKRPVSIGDELTIYAEIVNEEKMLGYPLFTFSGKISNQQKKSVSIIHELKGIAS